MLHWKVLFDCRTQKRGADYYRRGFVRNFQFDGKYITADVQGKRLYQVVITLERSEVADMDCTCPYAQSGFICKHMAAVLTAYDTEFEQLETQ